MPGGGETHPQLTPAHPRIARAPNGGTLSPERGELDARGKICIELTFPLTIAGTENINRLRHFYFLRPETGLFSRLRCALV
jgi:hypothetical protein